MLILEVLQGPDRGQRFELPDHEPQLIGRSTEAIAITDSTVSRRHAELTPDDGSWYLRDLDSANGTFLNGQKIRERAPLSPGDQVRCGATIFVVSFRGDPEPARAPIELLDPEMLDIDVEARDAQAASTAATRRSLDPFRLMERLTELIGSSATRAELLDGVMDLVFEELGPDRGFILLGTDPAARFDTTVIRYRVPPRTKDEGRIPVSRTIVQHVLSRHEGVLSTNAMNDARFAAGDSVRDYGIRSAICVPVVTGERLYGVIHVDSQLASFTFNENQLRLLGMIARQTGLALRGFDLMQARLQDERLATMGRTVASLSHSIRNILQGLRGGADTIELALGRGDVNLAREGWPILSRNMERILRLTQNMLAWSRPSTLDVELCDLHGLLGEACDLVRKECRQKRVALMLDLADAMPPVPVDANGLHQAVLNLLDNALDAVAPRRGVITLSTAYDEPLHEFSITVMDNGEGMDAALQAEVFDAFRTTKGQRGTGLGLAVTRKIVLEHGGRMELQSAPGQGAKFRIILPSDRRVTHPGETHPG